MILRKRWDIHTHGECSVLLNEDGRELNPQEIVENARVYTVGRRPRWTLLLYIPRALHFYNETLNRMDVVPNRGPHNLYRRSRCKRKKRWGSRETIVVTTTIQYILTIGHPRIHLSMDVQHLHTGMPQCKWDGALVKPLSPSPPLSYTLPQLHTHEYLYTSVAAVTADGCVVSTHTAIRVRIIV